jgi:rod shape-determining protein MreC
MLFSSKNRLIFIISLLILLSLPLSYSALSSYWPGYLSVAFNPVFRFSQKISDKLGYFLSAYSRFERLYKDNDYLRQHLIALSGRQAELNALREENKILRQELGFVEERRLTHVMAEVIGSYSDNNEFYLILNRGSAAGLKAGQAVTARGGVLIGTLRQVRPHLSFVRPLTSHHSRVSALINSQPNSLAIVTGNYNLNLKMEFIPKEITIKKDDLVTTSGLDNLLPAGLLIGRVYSFSHTQAKLWQTALIEPFINYRQVRLVDIILSESE